MVVPTLLYEMKYRRAALLIYLPRILISHAERLRSVEDTTDWYVNTRDYQSHPMDQHQPTLCQSLYFLL